MGGFGVDLGRRALSGPLAGEALGECAGRWRGVSAPGRRSSQLGLLWSLAWGATESMRRRAPRVSALVVGVGAAVTEGPVAAPPRPPPYVRASGGPPACGEDGNDC